MTISSLIPPSNLSISGPLQAQVQGSEINVNQVQNTDNLSETITESTSQQTKSNLIKKGLLTLVFLSATIFIAGIALFLLSPILAPVIPLVLIVSGVIFSASVVSLLMSYHSENKKQNADDSPLPRQDAAEDIKEPTPLPEDSQLVRMPITQPESADADLDQTTDTLTPTDDIQPETPIPEETDNKNKQKQAAAFIWQTFKNRNEALKNNIPNEYGIIEALPDYLILNEAKDEITENPHDLALDKITYSERVTLTKIKEIQPKRYYHYDKSSNKLNFVGVEPRLGLIKLKREVVLSEEQKEQLTGAVKTPLYHNQRHLILKRNIEDTEEEKSATIAQNDFFTSKLSRYQSIIPAYRLDEEHYISAYAGEELEAVAKSIKPESFRPLLSDLKKLRQEKIYIPDIKLNNIMCRNIKGKDCISLIDVDEASLHPLSPMMPININYPAFFVSEHLAQETTEADYYCMQNFVLLLMMYQADTKQYDEETLSRNYQLLRGIIKYDDPDNEEHQEMQADIYDESKELSFSQAYLTGFNTWVDEHVLPEFRQMVKSAIAKPSQHKVTTDLVDIFNFNASSTAEIESLADEEEEEEMITIL